MAAREEEETVISAGISREETDVGFATDHTLRKQTAKPTTNCNFQNHW